MLKAAFFSIWFIFHPVHVTVTSIEYVPGKDMFTAFFKLYYDDFLSDYKLSGGDTENVLFSVIDKRSLDEMEKYLNKRFSMKVNNEILKGNLKDIKVEGNEIRMNMELLSHGRLKEIIVKSEIMTGLYGDQSNMIIIKVNDLEEGFKLTPEKTEQTFKIK